MTRRVTRLVDDGLVVQANVDADARGVVVGRLTPAWPDSPKPLRFIYVAYDPNWSRSLRAVQVPSTEDRRAEE
jgi:hypothetical protein